MTRPDEKEEGAASAAPSVVPESDEFAGYDIGICQSCGSYWDARYITRCPCGGEVL